MKNVLWIVHTHRQTNTYIFQNPVVTLSYMQYMIFFWISVCNF